MRRITCDANEFDTPHGEQFLNLAIAAPSRDIRDLNEFLALVECSAVTDSQLLWNWGRWDQIRAHLQQFAGIHLPSPGEIRETRLMKDDWNEVELALEFGSVFVWYQWYTTA